MGDDVGLILLGAAVILGVPIMAIAAFFMANGHRSQLRLLTGRLERLERELIALRAQRGPEPAAEAIVPPVPDVAPTPPEPVSAAIPPQVATPPVEEPVAAVPPVEAPAPAARPAARPASTPSLEERLGARWAVWVGGIALALGGIFLVRYSIEEGLIGPGLRILAGLVFSLAVIVVGEFLRRRDPATAEGARGRAHIPGVVTAAGTASLFAIIYAAYALYGFLDSGTAFVILGLVGVATMFAAALHGPWLAGLGLIGAYGTPFLVSAKAPQPWALVLFLLVVTACAFLLARLRFWRWLAVVSLVLALAWGAIIVIAGGADLWPAATYIAVLTALAALVLIVEPHRGQAASARIDGVGLFALAGTAVLAVAFNDAGAFATLGLSTALLVLGTCLVLGLLFDAVAPAACIAALGLIAICLGWPIDLALARQPITIVPGSLTFAPMLPAAIEQFLTLAGLGGLVLFGATTITLLARARAPAPALALALAGAAGPVLLLAIGYLRVTGFGFSLPWAIVALIAAALHSAATERLSRAELAQTSGTYGPGSALQAGAASAALALGLTMLIEGSPLTLAFALASLAIAWVSLYRPLPALRWCAAALTLLVVVRFGGVEVLAGKGLTDFPGWRDIALRFALPAAAIGLGGYLLRRRAIDTPAAILDSGGIVLGTAAAAFAIRLYSAGPEQALSAPVGLAEAGLYTALAFGMALGFARSALRTSSIIHHFAAPGAAAGAVIVAFFGPITLSNPAIEGVTLGAGLFANDLLPGYALPAVLAALVAFTWQRIDAASDAVLKRISGGLTRPLALASGACALVLAFLYVTLETRLLVNGPDMSFDVITEGENYAYSAVWLVFGIALLAGGLLSGSRALRLASALVLLIAVAKVFLFDLRGLEGVWRALSFMGLGVVLIGIGLVYQRLLFGAGRREGA